MDQQTGHGHELSAAEAKKSPLLKKIKSLDDFKPDQNAIDEAVSVSEEAALASFKRKLGLK
jgi:hypothetical protein